MGSPTEPEEVKPSPFEPSDPERIAFVKKLLIHFMINNKVEMFEIRRAEALIAREQAEQRRR